MGYEQNFIILFGYKQNFIILFQIKAHWLELQADFS